MKQCPGCNRDGVKFPKRSKYCYGCRNRRRREKHNAYVRLRYQEDQKFRDRCKAKCRRLNRQRSADGYNRTYHESDVRRWLYVKTRNMRTHAKRDGLEYQITLDDLCTLWEEQGGLCKVSRLPMTHRFHDLFSASPDRIDSSKGYVRGNVQLICRALNLAKNDATNEQLVAFIERLRGTHDA